MKLKHHLILATGLLVSQLATKAADIVVTSDITSNTTWTKGNTYILDKSIFVKNGATLTIQPGTTVAGTRNPTNDTYGSLVITRDGTIQAVGTATEPIVMTAKQEVDGVVLDPAKGDGGYWGGLILLGKAPINFYTGPTTNANENSIEGFPAGSSNDIKYGGTVSNHSSGTLKYISIRFGGYVYDVGKEINGLTFGGVGSGTVVENIEIISNTDDGFEIFGGTVNTKRIAVAFCQDDGFDLDEGHQGFHQFWFSIQNADGTLGDRGGEWDGGNRTGSGIITGTPYTTASIYNATFIGDGTSTGGGNHGFFLDDNFAGSVHNSVAHDFSGSAVVNSGDGIGTPPPSFNHSTFGDFGGGYGVLDSVSGSGITKTSNPGLRGISRIPNGNLDPRPATNSALLTGSRSTFPVGAPAGFFEAANYRGAFGNTNWLNGWSYLSKKGYIAIPGAPVFTTQPTSSVVALGANASLTAVVTGKPAPTFQWFKDGQPLAGKTSATLALTKITSANLGSYFLRATSDDMSTDSATVVVRLKLPTGFTIGTAPGSKTNISNYFARPEFLGATSIEVVGTLPAGMTYNSATRKISGYPTADSAKATFRVTFADGSSVTQSLSFRKIAVAPSVLGNHVLQTAAGETIDIKIDSLAKATVVISKPGAAGTPVTGLVQFNALNTNTNRQWTMNLSTQKLALNFPVLRSLKSEDNSFLGNYGTYAGKPVWGFKAASHTGRITLGKSSGKVTIIGTPNKGGTISWVVTPTGGTAIASTGRMSADGIANLSVNVPKLGVLAGMIRIDEATDSKGKLTGDLNATLLQGFTGWTPVTYLAP
jgi:hypothetical protein